MATQKNPANISLKQALSVVGLASVLALAFGIPTALIPTPYYTRMTPVTFIDYFYLVAISSLLAFYLSLFVFSKLKSKIRDRSKVLGWSGGILGFLSFACPVCNVLLVSLFGSALLLTYFEPIRAYVGVMAIVLLLLAIMVKRRKDTCENCCGEACSK